MRPTMRPRVAPMHRGTPRRHIVCTRVRASSPQTDAAPTISDRTRAAFDQVAQRGAETQGE